MGEGGEKGKGRGWKRERGREGRQRWRGGGFGGGLRFVGKLRFQCTFVLLTVSVTFTENVK